MGLSTKAKKLYKQISGEDTKMGDIKKLAKEIKKDHDLAMELWSTGENFPRMLATLIMDKKLLTEKVIEGLMKDLEKQPEEEQTRITEWFMANQLMKDKATIAMIETWEDHKMPLLRRTFWYYQARLRWTGKTEHENTAALVKSLKKKYATEDPIVQWTMNFCAAWIGVFDKQYRKQMVAMGEKVGLYKDEKMVNGCTPNYLPEFIRIESEKRK